MNAMTNRWPTEAEAAEYYGNPTLLKDGSPRLDAEWERRNIVSVPLPWNAVASWDVHIVIRNMRVHHRCAESLARIFKRIWAEASRRNPAQPQAEIIRLGLHKVGGSFVYRPKRNARSLSMHAYGVAVDFDPDRNALGDDTPNFALPANIYVVEAFEAEGWVWGGRWSHEDGMHFQAARTK